MDSWTGECWHVYEMLITHYKQTLLLSSSRRVCCALYSAVAATIREFDVGPIWKRLLKRSSPETSHKGGQEETHPESIYGH